MAGLKRRQFPSRSFHPLAKVSSRANAKDDNSPRVCSMTTSFRLLTALVLTSMALSGCSLLTKQGRQERAYRNYIRHSSVSRVRQQTKFKRAKNDMGIPQDSGPVSHGANVNPESVTAEPQPTP
jgi:hypothetical protein